MVIDYQIQTTASDGKFSPRECVKMAKENDVLSIAITDHDTVGGINEALEAGKELGMEVIPGIELSCEYEKWGIHILGFGIDCSHQRLLQILGDFKRARETRAQNGIENLKRYGFAVEFEAVNKRAKGVISRVHVAEEIMENPANVEKLRTENIVTRQDLFNAYLADEAPKSVFVSHSSLTPEEAAEVIHEAGGVAIWSHPLIPMGMVIKDKNQLYKLVEETLGKFLEQGLDGIEVFSNADEDGTEFLITLSEKYKILKTAGTDFHDTYIDPKKPAEGSAQIGGYPTYGYSTDGIREALLAAIEKRKALSRS